jgi:UDP-glucose:(heptosyl)LPS alpha-1,3-glucosyltransferase
LKQGGAQHVIANSHMVEEEIIKEFSYPKDRITVIYNGLPDNYFKKKPPSRLEVRREWGLEDHTTALLFAGSGWDRKGLNYAVQAVERVSNQNICLLVAGSGRQQRYQSAKVRFLGPVRDMQSLFLAADTFVLPTVYDPFSNACLEALSCGLPVITTSTNGFAEIIVSGIHGEVIDRADNVPALHLAIEKWIDPHRRVPARELCSQVALQFTMEKNVEETLNVLRKLGCPEIS